MLAIAPLNRSFILEAGALEPLTALLCSRELPAVEAVVYTISLLSREEDARLNALPPSALQRLLELVQASQVGAGVRAAAAHTLTNLCRSLEHRCPAFPSQKSCSAHLDTLPWAASSCTVSQCRTQIVQQGGLEVLLGLLSRWEAGGSGGESASVIRDATACLLALLEDDQNKLMVLPASRASLKTLPHYTDASFLLIPQQTTCCSMASPCSMSGHIAGCGRSESLTPSVDWHRWWHWGGLVRWWQSVQHMGLTTASVRWECKHWLPSLHT